MSNIRLNKAKRTFSFCLRLFFFLNYDEASIHIGCVHRTNIYLYRVKIRLLENPV